MRGGPKGSRGIGASGIVACADSAINFANATSLSCADSAINFANATSHAADAAVAVIHRAVSAASAEPAVAAIESPVVPPS